MRLIPLLFLALVIASSHALAYPLYRDISDTAAAQAEARERGLPIAYVGTYPDCLTAPPGSSGDGDLTQMAITALQGRAVVITFDGHNMGVVPMMIHMQYHQPDDGPLSNGAAWLVPKVVFTDPGITKPLGRVSHTQMAAGQEEPIESALNIIKSDPKALTPRPIPNPPVGAPQGDGDGSENAQFGTLAWGINLVQSRWQFFAAGFVILVVALIARASRSS